MKSQDSFPLSSPFLVERDRELRSMWIWHGSGPPVMMLIGSAGTGKTTLAREFARRARSNYSEVLTIEAGSIPNTHSFLPYVANRLGWKFSVGKFPYYSIHSFPLVPRARKEALVLIDGLDAFGFPPREVVRLISQLWLSSRGGAARWLITSRINYLRHIIEIEPHHTDRTSIIQIGGFSESETHDFLRKRLRNLSSSIEFDLLTRVASQRLAGNPLYIDMLATSLSESGDLDSSISDLASHFRQGLTNLILSPARGGIAAIPVSQLAAHELIAPTGLSIHAAPYVAIPRFSLFWRSQLEAFEALINNSDSRERDFQAFFEENPHFLQGLEYERVIPLPVLERGMGQGSLIPDFFLQPIGSRYADILDLKLPTTSLVVGRDNRMRFSAAVHEALAQVREYQDYFEDPRNRKLIVDRYGITAYRPSAAVIIGRTPDSIDQEKLRAIRDSLPSRSKIITYDDLLLRMRRMADVYSI